jgi:hypothetical protein
MSADRFCQSALGTPLNPPKLALGSTTERYIHAARRSYPDAAELAEARL